MENNWLAPGGANAASPAQSIWNVYFYNGYKFKARKTINFPSLKCNPTLQGKDSAECLSNHSNAYGGLPDIKG
jgi:hypothetical protein